MKPTPLYCVKLRIYKNYNAKVRIRGQIGGDITVSKTRKDKLEEYELKYNGIPRDNEERLMWLIDRCKFSPKKMDDIIEKKRNMETFLQYYDIKIILYEDPEGAKRPRFRLVNRKNFMNVAMQASNFVHVYSPNAAEDHKYIHRLVDEELIQLNNLICTPVQVCINVFFKTPSYFNQADTILAEIGLHRQIQKPDWDNIGKKYTDMFNDNIWLDDNLVIDGEVHKYYSILPRVEIYIRYLNYITSIHQYNQIINRKGIDPDTLPIDYLDSMGIPSDL